jgi:hypothetical protein
MRWALYAVIGFLATLGACRNSPASAEKKFTAKEPPFALYCKHGASSTTITVLDNHFEVEENPELHTIIDTKMTLSDGAMEVQWKGISNKSEDGRYGLYKLKINRFTGIYLGEVAEYVANQAAENPLRISGLCEKIASRKF